MTAVAEGTYLAERIAEAGRDVALLEETYAHLRDGILHWSQFNEELTCPERRQAAEDECWAALEAARGHLEALQANGTALGRAEMGEMR